MNTLAKHVETLLLEHDCVIIQGFGGFIAQNKVARFVADEGVFYPPYRTVTFNQHLTADDGLLAQMYMQTYDASYPQALLQIEKEAAELDRELDLNGSLPFGSLGTLHRDIDDRITLVSSATMTGSPAMYGLSSFTIRNWKRQQKEEQAAARVIEMETAKREKAENKPHEHSIPFMYDMSVAAAIAAIIFMLFASPLAYSPQFDDDAYVAGMAHTPAHVSAPATVAAEAETYTIVLACYVSQKNATTFIDRLEKAGLQKARFVGGKKSQILYGTYSSQEEATDMLRQLRSQNRAFADGWVMQEK